MKHLIVVVVSGVLISLLCACSNSVVSTKDNIDSSIHNTADNIESSTLNLDSVFQNPDFVLSGGRRRTELCTKYITEFYGLHDFVAEIVDETKLANWMHQFESEERSLWELNLFSIVQELDIPKETLAQANADVGYVFSDTQIESLYSGNIKKVNECFANPYSLVVDGEIFTPDWLAVHTASDYSKNGITFDALEKYLKTIDIPDLNFACIPVAFNAKKMKEDFPLSSVKQLKEIDYDPKLYVVPENIYSLIPRSEYEEWASQFLAENSSNTRNFSEFNMINLFVEKEIMPIENDEIVPRVVFTCKNDEEIKKAYNLDEILKVFSIEKNNISYSLAWLSSQTISELANNAITTTDLEGLLLEMQDYSFTSEYEWIKSCYDRMLEDAVG